MLGSCYPLAAVRPQARPMGGPFASLYSSLRMQLPLNEASGAAIDSRGNYTTTAVNAPGAGTTSPFSERRFVKATASRFTLTPDNSLAGIGTSISVSFWIWPEAGWTGNNDVLGVRSPSGSGNASYIVRLGAGQFYTGTGAGGLTNDGSLGAPTLSAWNHYAFTWNTTTGAIRHRRNGGTVNTFTATNTPVALATLMSVGGYDGATDSSDSRMAIVKSWTRVLTDAEMLLDYNGGAGVIL